MNRRIYQKAGTELIGSDHLNVRHKKYQLDVKRTMYVSTHDLEGPFPEL